MYSVDLSSMTLTLPCCNVFLAVKQEARARHQIIATDFLTLVVIFPENLQLTRKKNWI